MTAYAKPLPSPTGLHGEFYAWCKRGELRFQKCGNCGKWRHVPREMCAACGSFDWSWEVSGGRGRVFTWTVTAVPLHPAFKSDTPYAAVVIEMEEGVRLVSRIADCPPDELYIEMPVRVGFEHVTDAIALPVFHRIEE